MMKKTGFEAGDGNNTLIGGGGNDTLIAGDGNDWIDAGLGDDTMTQGMGTTYWMVVTEMTGLRQEVVMMK